MPGQIQPNSAAGYALAQIALRDEVKSVMEIGTWDGMGSTLCIGHALRCRPDYKDVTFTSYEADEGMYKAACRNYPSGAFPGVLEWGTFASVADMERLEDYGDEYFQIYNREDQAKFWETDRAAIESAPLVALPVGFNTDLLVLDGGEYSTWHEYNLLKDKCLYLFLDDTWCIKTAKARADVIASGLWDYEDYRDDRCGWMIAKRK